MGRPPVKETASTSACGRSNTASSMRMTAPFDSSLPSSIRSANPRQRNCHIVPCPFSRESGRRILPSPSVTNPVPFAVTRATPGIPRPSASTMRTEAGVWAIGRKAKTNRNARTDTVLFGRILNSAANLLLNLQSNPPPFMVFDHRIPTKGTFSRCRPQMDFRGTS